MNTTSNDGLTTGADSAGSNAPRTVNADARDPGSSSPPPIPEAPAPQEPRWQPIETAPKDGMFLVTDGTRCLVASGKILWLSKEPTVPLHLSGHHWTYWQPLPPLPLPPETGSA